jgi:hypothetical protein
MLHHDLLAHNAVNTLDKIPPNNDPESVHKEIDSSFDPDFLVFLEGLIEIFETSVF